MNTFQLDKLQKAFKVTIPKQYSKLITALPDDVVNHWKSYSPDRKFLSDSWVMLMDDYQILSEFNNIVRARFKWDANYFATGKDRWDEYDQSSPLCIKSGDPKCKIYIFDKLREKYTVFSPSLDAHLEKIRDVISQESEVVPIDPEAKLKLLLERCKLLGHGKDLDRQLFEAVSECFPYGVKSLIEKGADLNARIPVTIGSKSWMSLLSMAVDLGDVETVETLLKAGADPNNAGSKNQFPILHRAASTGNISVVKLLVKFGAHIDSMFKGKNALQYAQESFKVTPDANLKEVIKYLKGA